MHLITIVYIHYVVLIKDCIKMIGLGGVDGQDMGSQF